MDLLTLILFLIGLVILIVGAELLVRGASSLAVSVGISPLVVGLTVVAFGTSSPELAVIVQSGLVGQSDIAIGNVVGSNICNILLVLGLSAIATPLLISRQLVRFDGPLMVGVSFLLLFIGADGLLSRLDGALLTVGIISYTGWSIHKSRADTARKKENASVVEATTADDEIQPSKFGAAGDVAFILVGLAMLVLGARWLVNGAVAFATMLGVSELIIGLTIIAVGTSLPEIATSVVAGLRGKGDIVVGNVVGSNIFNILMVLGLGSLVAPIGVSQNAIQFDIPVMIGVALMCLPIFFTGKSVTRWEGMLFFGYYVAYTVYLVLISINSSLLPLFSQVMLYGAIPLTVFGLLFMTVRGVVRRVQRKAA